jgi:predicted Zn finger-like uncharacterized protein
MIQVECPSCAKSYQVPKEKLGSRAKCKSCAETFTLMIAADETHSSRTDSPGEPNANSFASFGANPRPVSERLDHFVLKRKLGAGAMGEVWLAEDLVLEREVAVKRIPAATDRDPGRRKRFLREAKLAAKLNHPNAVTVHQASLQIDSLFLVMELVNGDSLDKMVAALGHDAWHITAIIVGNAVCHFALGGILTAFGMLSSMDFSDDQSQGNFDFETVVVGAGTLLIPFAIVVLSLIAGLVGRRRWVPVVSFGVAGLVLAISFSLLFVSYIPLIVGLFYFLIVCCPLLQQVPVQV